MVNYVNPHASHAEQLKAPCCMFYYQFYENSFFCHYDVIVNCDKTKVPVPPKCHIYHYGKDDLSNFCCSECCGNVTSTIKI